MADHWKEKERFLTGLITAAAGRRLRRAEDARDCVVIFLEKALEMPEAQDWPFSAEDAAILTVAAERCAKTEAERLRRLRMHERCFIEICVNGTQTAVIEPVCQELGPEERIILRSTVNIILTAAAKLRPCYRSLFRAVFVDSVSETELARKTGRSQQSVNRSVHRLKAALRKMLSRTGINESEIVDLMSLVDRCRCLKCRARRGGV